MQALILAGGLGTRLKPITNTVPKPMIPILGKPLLSYLVENLSRQGITEIIFSLHYLSETIKNYFQNGNKFGIRTFYAYEAKSLGSGGAVKNCQRLLQNQFLLLNGDVFQQLDFSKLIKFHEEKQALVTLVCHKSDHPFDSDLVKVDKNMKILGFFRPKIEARFRNLGNAGVFCVDKKICNYIPKNQNLSWEKDILARLVARNFPIYSYKTRVFLKDIGTVERLKAVESHLTKIKKVKR